ncbi:MAG TPA: adenylate/guanylate cyclase domain-containing protein [Actinomycetota bacterium]|jgi:class 3 adenylate cyclase|nr:adenylate/guanylate cyclase domain-containing protein [Actinomycetota bacterium]
MTGSLQTETKYATCGEVHIAYQVVGSGPPDLVLVPGFVSNVELVWDLPGARRSLEQLAAFSRLITFDKRGTGLSDRDVGAPSLEERMDDVRAVMDAAGSKQAALMGVGDGGPLCLLFAATYPDRVSALVLYHTFARLSTTEGYPIGVPREQLLSFAEWVKKHWGSGRTYLMVAVPESARDQPELVSSFARLERQSASPSTVGRIFELYADLDVRNILPAVQASAVVLTREDDPSVPAECGTYLARNLPNAKLLEMPTSEQPVWTGDFKAMDVVQEFLTGARPVHDKDRVLATVLYTDFVDSTVQVASKGDRKWRDVLEAHDLMVDKIVHAYEGRLVKSTGDGILATFDGPARAVRCALEIRESLSTLGVEMRAGLHSGEIELRGNDIAGIAVHIASRVNDLAGPGEVLASRTVADLVLGSEIVLQERGIQRLKGVPGEWEVYSVIR